MVRLLSFAALLTGIALVSRDWSYIEIIQTKLVVKITKHILFSMTFFFGH